MNENPFSLLDPHDGFRVEEVFLPLDSGNICVGLYGYASQNGERLDLGSGTFPIYEAKSPTEQQKAEYLRLRSLTAAVCRYLTLGGSWDSLQTVLGAMRAGFAGFELPFDEWILLDEYVDVEGSPTAVWGSESGSQAVRWVDGLFVDTGLTVAQIANELRDQQDQLEKQPENLENEPGFDAERPGEGKPAVRRLPAPECGEDADSEGQA